jgi:hypothetical protein
MIIFKKYYSTKIIIFNKNFISFLGYWIDNISLNGFQLGSRSNLKGERSTERRNEIFGRIFPERPGFYWRSVSFNC